jgi:hypothetical protein
MAESSADNLEYERRIEERFGVERRLRQLELPLAHAAQNKEAAN